MFSFFKKSLILKCDVSEIIVKKLFIVIFAQEEYPAWLEVLSCTNPMFRLGVHKPHPERKDLKIFDPPLSIYVHVQCT